ncbi:MAG: oxidoreductase [Alphaproteobacteria bacterium]|nr:oxidoreductase [Alphaproteobacteria bacterium]
MAGKGKTGRPSARSKGAAAKTESGRLRLRLRAVTHQAEDTRAFEFVDPDGRELPPFTAGAHIDVHLPGELTRQYSLCNDPVERHRYVVAVLREPAGRGGSRTLHDHIKVGDVLEITAPRNNFAIDKRAKRHLLLAGGIGVTPMLAMIHTLQAGGADFTLYYCTRNWDKTAFRDELGPLIETERAIVHHDDGRIERSLDLGKLLKQPAAGTHVYYCGPAGFMRAAKAAAEHWPKGTVHFEYFSVDAAPAQGAPQAADTAKKPGADFQIKIASTGQVLDVPLNRTIVEVLAAAGISVETSCEAGLCGTCRTRYLAGEPEHRDYILDEDEQREYVLICCARAKSHLLVLDL